MSKSSKIKNKYLKKFENFEFDSEETDTIRKLINLLVGDEEAINRLIQERQFVENTFAGRFNFFIVFFSLFATAGFTNNFKTHKYIVFFAGALFLLLCWGSLYRMYERHDFTIAFIYKYVDKHPAFLLGKIMEEGGYKQFFRFSKWMGVYIPIFCIALLVAAGVCVCLRILK
jgi:myosin-crossreactive antigen